MRSVRAEDPTTSDGVPESMDEVSIESLPHGVVVPNPELLLAVTINDVLVLEPIAKAGPMMPFGLMESIAQGDEEACPTKPVELIKIVDVACATPESLPTRKLPLARVMPAAAMAVQESVPEELMAVAQVFAPQSAGSAARAVAVAAFPPMLREDVATYAKPVPPEFE